jgi:nuclear RNA export factor
VWLKVNAADAPHLLRLNGYTYAGAPLTIEETTDPFPGTRPSAKDSSEPKTSETKDKLLAVLAARYNPEQKLLDFSALGTDQTLFSMGAFGSKALAEKSFKALLRLTAMHYDNPAKREAAIQAVSIANNEILDVGEVFTLAHTLPRLRRLDLSGNKLEDFSKLSKWRHEFRRLEELHLVGNPVTNLPNYPSQVTEWFPNLQILDGRRVRTPEEAAEALKAWFPVPLPHLPSNLRDGENNVASSFIRGFFTHYDHDRVSLIRQFYDDESIFSLMIGSNSETDVYYNYSRNLELVGVRSPATQQRLFGGANVIAELWSRLPATRHFDLDQAGEWQIDCHTFPSLADPSGQGPAMGLTITTYSRFEEINPTLQVSGMRAFSRAFVLGPSKPGSTHPYRVVSDELTLRAWIPLETDDAIPAPPAEAVATTLAAPAAPSLTEEQQLWMVQEVMKRTGMNAEYSRLCLTGAANWNLDLALQVFNEKRAELPAEAFTTPV